MILQKINNVQQMTPLILRLLGMNPSQFTLQGTNTYLLGTKQNRVLIDSGEGIPQYLENIKEVLKQQNCKIDHIFITHNHSDHIGGVEQFEKLSPETKFYKMLPFENSYSNITFNTVTDAQIFNFENFNVQAIKCPGHTEDHCAYYLPQENALFCGDIVLGEGGTTVIEDLQAYIDSLEKLLDVIKKNNVEFLFCGHGIEIKGQENCLKLVQSFYNHRMQREHQIQLAIQKLGTQNKNNLAAIDQILQIVYPGIEGSLIMGAKTNIIAHANRLANQNLIQKILNTNTQFDDYRYIGGEILKQSQL